jgi:hypothetical protein
VAFGTFLPFPMGARILTWVCGGVCAVATNFLPKLRLEVAADRKALIRTSGPWTGFWSNTSRIPLDRVHRVVYRWTLRKSKGGGHNMTAHRLTVENKDGKEIDLLPASYMAGVPTGPWGQSLAQFLAVEFHAQDILVDADGTEHVKDRVRPLGTDR